MVSKQSFAAYLPPPEHDEVNGGAAIAGGSPQTLDSGESMEEQHPRRDVIANLAWVVDSGATFDTVPLGFAKQEDLQRIPLMTPLRSTRQTVQLLLNTAWSCSYLECPSMSAQPRCPTLRL